MRAIEKWSDGKPLQVAVPALSIAWANKTIFELIKSSREAIVHLDSSKKPSIDQWLSLYTDNRRIVRETQELINSFGGFASEIVEFDQKTNNLKQKIRHIDDAESIPFELRIEAENHLYKSLPDLGERQLQFFHENIHGASSDGPFEDFKVDPTMIFLFSVYLPSWLLYRQPPAILLRNARKGKIDDIEKILRLDPTSLFDKKISAYFHNARFKNNQYSFQRLLKSLNRPPKAKITQSKIKMTISGFISVQSEFLGHRLYEPDIRALFDAFAIDQGIGDIDVDIPDSPAAFSIAINRERKFWIPILPNKK